MVHLNPVPVVGTKKQYQYLSGSSRKNFTEISVQMVSAP